MHRTLPCIKKVLYSIGPRSPPPSNPVHHQHLHQQRTAPYALPPAPSHHQQAQDLTPTNELLQLLKSSTPAAVTAASSSSAAPAKPEYSATDLTVPRNRFMAAAGIYPSSHLLASSIPPPLSSDLPQSLATSSIRDDLGGQRLRQNFRGLTHTQQYQVFRGA